jgi:hypothetical protein
LEDILAKEKNQLAKFFITCIAVEKRKINRQRHCEYIFKDPLHIGDLLILSAFVNTKRGDKYDSQNHRKILIFATDANLQVSSMNPFILQRVKIKMFVPSCLYLVKLGYATALLSQLPSYYKKERVNYTPFIAFLRKKPKKSGLDNKVFY